MSVAENKTITCRYFEALWTKKDPALVDEICSSKLVEHNPAISPVLGHSLESSKQFIAMIHSAYPDLQFRLEDQIAEGDKVVTRWSARGTHKGKLMDIPPTHKQVTLSGIHITRLENEKIVEVWVNWDIHGMMQQLGVAPPSMPEKPIEVERQQRIDDAMLPAS